MGVERKTASPGRGGAAVGERDVAATMRRMLGGGTPEPDDVGYARVGKKKTVVINTDTWVQSTDMPPRMTLRQAARKSVVSCISDLAAKGARPMFGTISVNIPRGATRGDIRGMAGGFAAAAAEYDVRIVAGDTNAGREFVFNVCMVGEHVLKRRVARGGAGPGDGIFVTGPFGYTALGYKVLLEGHAGRGGAVRRAVRSVLRPEARAEFGARCAKYFTSAMDSSDGLGFTLNEMARQSGRTFEVRGMPATAQLERYARQNGMSLEELVFYGGEEYEIVFTATASGGRRIARVADRLGVPLMEIGTVKAAGRGGGGGRCSVYVRRGGGNDNNNNNGARIKIGGSGWEHLAS